MKMLLKQLLILLLLVAPATAANVSQSGNVTPGHLTAWATTGVVKDAGTATNPFANTFGLIGGPFCINSGPTTGAYNAFCLQVDSTNGGIVSIYNHAGATGGISFSVNGTVQGIPLVPLPTTAGDLTCFSNTAGSLVDCGFAPSTNPLVVGTTPVNDGTNAYLLYNNAGILGNESLTSILLSPPAIGGGTPNTGAFSTLTLTNPLGLAYGGLGGSQSAATVGSLPVFPGSGGAAVPTPLASLSAQIWLGDARWGAKCDGSTDDTTAIQAAWNYAASVGKDLNISGVGTQVCKFSSLTAPTPTVGESGNRSALIGAGSGTVVLQSTVTGTTCAITLNDAGGSGQGDYNVTFRGFSLLGAGVTSGYGLCLNHTNNLYVNDVWFGIFNDGVHAIDSIKIDFTNCTWQSNTYGIRALHSSVSYPNAWSLNNPHFFFNASYGAYFDHPANLVINGGDWENNGGNVGAVTIYIAGNPVDGTSGLNLNGGYFATNAVVGDIVIDQLSGTEPGAHKITGAEFQRVNSFTLNATNNIVLTNSGTGLTKLLIQANGFKGFGSYVPDAGRLYIVESTPAGTNYFIKSGANYFDSATETPTGPYWDETDWTAYTPTLGCSGGTITTATAAGTYKYLTEGTILVSVSIIMTTIGSCTGAITATLPITAQDIAVGASVNAGTQVAGTMRVAAASNTGVIYKYDGTAPMVNGDSLVATLKYDTK